MAMSCEGGVQFSAAGVLWLVGCLALTAGIQGTARGDVYALANSASGPFGVVHYDNNGRFVRFMPGVIESTDGLTSTPDGWLYVAGNILGGGYLARSRADGPIAWQAVTPVMAGTPYTGPGGLTTGPDGSIYATSNSFRTNGVSGVFRYNPADGTFTQVVNVPDAASFSLFRLAVAPGGDVYLAHGGVGIERYAAGTGRFDGVVIPQATTGAVRDLDFGPDGHLYIPTPAGVDRYNAQTGALIDHFIPNGSGGLNGATDLAFGGGLLYVNSAGASSILRYDAVTGAFRDVYVAPDQYALGAAGSGQMTYVVPEPSAAGLLVVSLCLLRRRK